MSVSICSLFFCLINSISIENLSNSDLSNYQKLGLHFNITLTFYKIYIHYKNRLKQFFEENVFIVVIHFAGLKLVTESVTNPDLSPGVLHLKKDSQ